HYASFAKHAANKGYHVIVLQYWNSDDAGANKCMSAHPNDPAAQNTCVGELYEGWYRDNTKLDPTFTQMPKKDPQKATGWQLNREDQFQNRLRQALKYLDKHFPEQGWHQFAAWDGFDDSPYL